MAPRSFRFDRSGALLAALLLIALTAALTSLVWWSVRRPAPASPPVPAPAPAPAQDAQPRLGRAELLDLAAAAASAQAAGQAPPDQAAMVGRPFELRIAFACGAPDLTVSRDLSRGSLKLTARPQDWTASAVVRTLAPASFERVEGFWIPRPWIRGEDCAAVSPPLRTAAMAVDRLVAGPEAASAPGPEPGTVGLASFFEPGASRVFQRGGKPYESVQKIEGAVQAAPGDPSLVIRGRIAEAVKGRPVVCHAPVPDRRPVCLIAVEVERVAFVRPGADKPVAEWLR
ncbi:MAG TPA: hypothetical protein VEA44_14245 [Caulobacter sp.]|nr:hypothetical protein [Caulobacter sp.]